VLLAAPACIVIANRWKRKRTRRFVFARLSKAERNTRKRSAWSRTKLIRRNSSISL